MTTPRKTADLIRLVVAHLDGRLGRSRLVKMMYLADVESRRHLGHPISDLNYYVDNFGPFDSALYGHVAELGDEIAERTYRFGEDGEGCVYSYSGDMPATSLDPAEKRIAEWIVTTYGELPWSELIDDHVKTTKPWQLANRQRRYSPLPMNSANNADRDEFFGFSLEKALASDRAFEVGDSVTLSEFTDEHQRLHPPPA